MSAQLLELLVFAGIAFYLVNKLLSMLGHSEDGVESSRGYFGEAGAKDVTATVRTVKKGKKALDEVMNSVKGIRTAYADIIDAEKKDVIYEGFKRIASELQDFDPRVFINGAAQAVPMIIDVARSGNEDDLATLVDKRFIEEFTQSLKRYPKKIDAKELKLTINDIYFFAHNAFIKVNVKFKGKLVEEWIFSKNMGHKGPHWLFCNIG